MTLDNAPARQSGVSGKTVQDYIDETPVWSDATPLRSSPLTDMQWLIWGLAAAGKFFEGMVVFTTGVALPLMADEFALGASEKGVVAASSLFGILIGATLFGGLADRYGRKQMFIVEMVLFGIFTAVLTFSPSYLVAVAALVGIGVALGCDYPTAHLIISESIPSRIRGRMVLAAFGFQAVGGLVGTAVGFLILFENPELGAWRWMYASTIVLAVPVIIGRFFIVQSPLWLMFHGRVAEAEAATERLLLRDPPYPREVVLHSTRDPHHHPRKMRWFALFQGTNLQRTILASVPWFLQDLGTYGIGIFTPTILATVVGARIDHPRNTAELIQSDILATKGAAFIDVLLRADLGKRGRETRTRAADRCRKHLARDQVGHRVRADIGHETEQHEAAEEQHARDRSADVERQRREIGTDLLLLILVGTSLVGALVTWRYAIETKGINLEKLGENG
jgi:putative MFS transporter